MWPKLVTIDMVAPNTTVPELPVRRASEDPHEVADATFKYNKVIGNRTVHINTLKHGTSTSESPERVHHLAKQMSGPGGYISRPIVDDSGEVLEGQHRVAALKHLGVKKVPVTVVKNLARSYDEDALEKAARSVGGLHPDQVKGLVHNALETSHEAGGPSQAMSGYDHPRGFEKHYAAVFNAMKAKKEAGDRPPDHVVRRLLPAVKHLKTGKVYTGRRGDQHYDIIVNHGLQSDYDDWTLHDKPNVLSFGFHDPKTKKFLSREESGVLYSSSLMSKIQRMRKYGTESTSHVLSVLFEVGNDPSKLFYIATYDRVREIFTANSEYDTFEAARKHLKDEDNEWIISPYRGKDFMYVAIQPKLPSLIWSFPLNKVEFAGQPNTWIKLR